MCFIFVRVFRGGIENSPPYLLLFQIVSEYAIYSHFYKIFTLCIVRQEYTNKGEEGKKRKLMAWVEVYGGQRSLAFELTTATLSLEIHNKCTPY